MNGAHYSIRNHRGFTLIEILIAVVILAAVLSTIFAAYSGTFRIIEDTESRSEIDGMARTAVARIQEDLECALPLEAETEKETGAIPIEFVGENPMTGQKDADGLRFYSSAHVRLTAEEKDPGIVQVTYDVREREDGDELALYRTETPWYRTPPEPGTGGFLLCDRLTRVDFTFYNAEGDEFETWESGTERFGTRLPETVSISLEFSNRADPETPTRFTGGAALPVSRTYHVRATEK